MEQTIPSGATAAPEAPVAAEADASRCPVDHRALAAAAAEAEASGCPIDHRALAARPVPRSKADEFVRRLLRIPERPAGVTKAAAYQAFQKSMLISATRCTLTYVIFPFVLPMIGIAARGAIGVVIGVVAMVADVFTIRRFFAVDHKYRWYFTTIVLGIMALLTALLVQDISHLASGTA